MTPSSESALAIRSTLCAKIAASISRGGGLFSISLFLYIFLMTMLLKCPARFLLAWLMSNMQHGRVISPFAQLLRYTARAAVRTLDGRGGGSCQDSQRLTFGAASAARTMAALLSFFSRDGRMRGESGCPFDLAVCRFRHRKREAEANTWPQSLLLRPHSRASPWLPKSAAPIKRRHLRCNLADSMRAGARNIVGAAP